MPCNNINYRFMRSAPGQHHRRTRQELKLFVKHVDFENCCHIQLKLRWHLQRVVVVFAFIAGLSCCAVKALSFSATVVSHSGQRQRQQQQQQQRLNDLKPSIGATNLLLPEYEHIIHQNVTDQPITDISYDRHSDIDNTFLDGTTTNHLPQRRIRHSIQDARDHEQPQPPTTVRSPWRRRHARSISEGIRREKTFQSILKKAHFESFHANRHYFARTIAGFLSAVAEESQGLIVQVNSQKGSPLWEKRIDSIEINFSRLAFRPLRLGGLHNNATTADSTGLKATLTNSSMKSRTVLPTSTVRNATHVEMASVRTMNEAFEQIDVDKSGTLDRDEIAKALDLATELDSDEKLLTALASELVDLYDTNGDGVVDFEEYQLMVRDMAKLRKIQLERKREEDSSKEKQSTRNRWFSFGRDAGVSADHDGLDDEKLNTTSSLIAVDDNLEKDSVAKGTGTITLTDLKLDLRQLLFGCVPLVKKITPGGPLVLEPFTCTIHGSLNKEDVMESVLVDMGLRRLVARALRRRMGSVRDIIDGAFFYGRSWNMASGTAPVIEVPRLTQVEFDAEDRLIITGRAIVKTSPDSPVIENAFKVRTKIGTRKDGHVIRLEQPELALVMECPRSWERNIASICKKLNWPIPKTPDPLYSFFPIYSPFKVEDNDGFDLGPDNRIKSLYISEGALRFEMESILRPGRFLGSYYIAFTVPIRTFLITMDRVVSGIRSARKNKRALQRENKLVGKQDTDLVGDLLTRAISPSASSRDSWNRNAAFSEGDPAQHLPNVNRQKTSRKANKNFFSRFVDGYLGVGNGYDEVRNERLVVAISDWFGRQGNSTLSNETAVIT